MRSTLCSIGTVLDKMGKLEEALKNYNKSLEIKIRVRGLEHLDVAKTQNNIAIIFQQQGKYPEALEMYQKSLATKEKVLGPEHPDAAKTYHKYDVCNFRGSSLLLV